jgi:hypothetical protein
MIRLFKQLTPQDVHVDGLGEPSKRKRKERRMTDTEEQLFKAEAAIYKRDFTAEERKKLADEGKALPNGAYPIETSADLHPAAVLARSGHGDVAGAKSLIARRAKELGASNPLEQETKKTEDVSIEVPIWKSAIEGKVYGVVLEPDLTDSQGDKVSPAEIEKACHKYMAESQKADVQHNEVQAGAHLIENYIAPQDLTLEGEHVTKGSWVQAWQITDPVVKKEVDDGRLTGFSIGGAGVRLPDAE